MSTVSLFAVVLLAMVALSTCRHQRGYLFPPGQKWKRTEDELDDVVKSEQLNTQEIGTYETEHDAEHYENQHTLEEDEAELFSRTHKSLRKAWGDVMEIPRSSLIVGGRGYGPGFFDYNPFHMIKRGGRAGRMFNDDSAHFDDVTQEYRPKNDENLWNVNGELPREASATN